jgi:intracellular septation protein
MARDGIDGMTDGQGAAPAKRATINPILKLFLELGPLALFFIAFLKGDLFVATAAMMAAVVVTLAVSYALLRRIPTMPLVTAGIVLVFGGLTLYFHNKLFIELKPTVLYLLFGGALFGGLVFNRPMLPILFDGALHVTPEGWRLLTWRWASFFLVLAVLNIIIVIASRTWTPDTDLIWANFKAFGIMPLIFLFAIAQTPLIMRHELKQEEQDGVAL